MAKAFPPQQGAGSGNSVDFQALVVRLGLILSVDGVLLLAFRAGGSQPHTCPAHFLVLVVTQAHAAPGHLCGFPSSSCSPKTLLLCTLNFHHFLPCEMHVLFYRSPFPFSYFSSCSLRYLFVCLESISYDVSTSHDLDWIFMYLNFS